MKPEELKVKRILVVGAGVTGLSVMRYLQNLAMLSYSQQSWMEMSWPSPVQMVRAPLPQWLRTF